MHCPERQAAWVQNVSKRTSKMCKIMPLLHQGLLWGQTIKCSRGRLLEPIKATLEAKQLNIQYYQNFFFLICHSCSLWKFLGQGWNLHHSSDNARSLMARPPGVSNQNNFNDNFFFLFSVIGVTYGSFQARSWIRATSATCITAHGNAGLLTHWARAGMEPASSWILVGSVTTEP